ncbi:DUF2865 domain-containing protein [Devosia sp.]|jgi:hypothetical protein|uniref:DUF2865 domain-containing protein n=1 Tax=Devosia sp. TaxID=1871048 RepID=UPI0037C11852
MLRRSTTALRLFVMVMAGLAVVMLDASTAFAQSSSCAQLGATLQTLERNRAYQAAQDGAGSARSLQRQVQRNESAYIRGGCNDDAKAGRQLSRECKALAREITSGREEVANLSRTLETGNAIAQQREAILQEMARFNCGGGSQARVVDENGNVIAGGRQRGNLFDQLFDALGDSFDGGGGLRGGEFDGYGSYHTVRTLCVRKSDGFYWPISYSTLTDYIQNDLDACRSQCPTLDVDLYYYDNPGQEVEQMVNIYGEAYTALPNAFRFRTEIDKTATCKQASEFGSVTLVAAADGSARAIVNYNGLEFPLPVRDPRGVQQQITTVALDTTAYVQVPLPRRRPAAPGEAPKPVPVKAATTAEPSRIVQFGDKRVRVVGPDTPYAPTAATGT